MTQFSKWKTVGYAAAIFVAGSISGGALGIYETKSHLFVPPRQQEVARHLLGRLRNRLGLTPDQVAKVAPIIENTAADIRSIRIEAAQRINKVFDDSYAQVSAILTPEQRTTFDQMQRQRREMMQRHWQEAHRRAGPGGPGGFNHNGPDNSPHDGPGPAPSVP